MISKNNIHYLSVKSIGNSILINFDKEYRDDLWAETFGGLYVKVKMAEGKDIIFDFSKCKWIDPGPLLSIALLVDELIQESTKIIIVLPHYFKATQSQKGFLGFLVKENFLNCLLRRDNNKIPDSISVYFDNLEYEITDTIEVYIKQILPFATNSAYRNATCIPAQIISDLQSQSIDTAVDKMIEGAKKYSFKNQFDASTPSNISGTITDPNIILQEVRQVLFELLKNVQEHAYSNTEQNNGSAAVYGRIRYGFSDTRKIDRPDKLIDYYKKEDAACPQLYKSTHLQHFGFVELFVSDSGVGITKDYVVKKNYTGKNPLKSFFRSMPTPEAFSSHSSEKRLTTFKSPMPGLKYISDVLSTRRGFMRILHDHEWCGASFPFSPENVTKLSQTVSLSDNKPSIRGTHFCVRISSGDPFELPNNWDAISFDNTQKSQKSLVFQAYNSTHQSPADWRKIKFNTWDEQNFKFFPDDEKNYISTFEIGGTGRSLTKIVWRPPKSILRDEIPSRLREVSKRTREAHVIIIDQDISAAIMTHWSLVNTESSRYPNIRRISVVANTICVADVLKKGRKFVGTNESVLLNTDIKNFHMGHIISLFKEIDSKMFWEEINRQKKTHQYLINENIVWEEDPITKKQKNIELYIDFTNTLNNPICRWVYKRALGRLMSYLSPQKKPYPIDHIVEAFISNFFFNSNYNYTKKKDGSISKYRPVLLVGSVVVSGKTSGAIESEWGHLQSQKKPILTHFLPPYSSFKSKGDNSKFTWLLNWNWISENIQKDEFRVKRPKNSLPLRRVLDSPMVGYGGNKHWVIVRKYYDEKNKLQNIYGCSPENPKGFSARQAYAYWQNNNLLKFGHWVASNHHDCISLNLMEALKFESISMKGPIWNFIKSHFQRLNPDYKVINGFKECQILASIVNEETMYILSTLRKIMPFLNNKIIMLPYTQGRRKSMRLRVGSLEEQSLRERIQQFKSEGLKVNVMLFDTVISSSRTFRELRNLVKGCGADEVLSVSLIDRTRVPNQVEIFNTFDNHRDARLWRYDLDFLSPSENHNYSSGCPLCECEKRIDSILKTKLTARVKYRVKHWKRTIKLKRLSNSTPLDGLQKETLYKPIDISFGLDKSKITASKKIPYNDKVYIEESTALSAILTEILTITGEHALTDKLISEVERDSTKEKSLEAKEITSKITIELLISQLVYLKNDIGYRRKLDLTKALLLAIYKSPRENSATAFACSIILGFDKILILELARVLKTSIVRLKIGSNFDFNLIASFLLSYLDKIEINEVLREAPLLQSFVQLFKPINVKFPRSLIDLMLIIGLRDGSAHHTMLATMLFSSRNQKKNYNVLCSIVQKILVLLKSLNKESYYFPSFASKQNLLHCSNRLDEVYSRLKKIQQGHRHLDEKLLNTIFEYLRYLFYGGKNGESALMDHGIKGELKNSFIKSIGQIQEYLEIKIKEEDKIPTNNYLIDKKEYFSDKDNLKILSIFTENIEKCIFEHIDNANKYRVRDARDTYDFEILIGSKSNKLNEQAITIDIRNRKEENTSIPMLYTANQNELEFMGGNISRIEDDNDFYCVRITLPTPNSLSYTL